MVTFILGMIWGIVVYHIVNKYIDKKTQKEISKNIFNSFREVLSNVKKDKTVFVSRVNQTVIFDTRIEKYDVVNIVYLMDKQVVCIFKDNNCIYTSDSLDNNLKSDLLIEINEKFKKQINDVVNIMGMTISKEEFNVRMQEIQNMFKQNPNTFGKIDELLEGEGEMDKIIDENENKFDIDSILDKISKSSYDSLTNAEKDFLNNYSNNYVKLS